ncbi:hypothetical protein [Porphyromonas levii]|uniref:hypothetical protein n=1 Tax=Porphyromonas levii TaxID=28114 RepID=UPI00035C98FC|nr:hypothetical protein [Porphyromonas levii]MBR8703114.1 hypothetical protein [Porphyromonas levii]MBR8713950.1 hypothetical protein [Porphyromonas levii]MBR8715970.1 hypothetical protein [Porphyromonas levii]MBR8728497.1 hypothetical protein [Porphyromonas levii]MBR8729566.1 hypothetical protein [Porphyromonas levii]
MNFKIPSNKDVYAAIAMALHETLGTPHDRESNVITIDKAKHSNSPWGSKVLTLRQLPRRK